MKITIAAYQMPIHPSDLENNYEHIQKAAEKATKKKANFLVLPELCWSGPFYQERKENEVALFAKERASFLSKKYHIYIVAGTFHEVKRGWGNDTYNMCYVFDPQGNIAGYYAKRHLFKGEKSGGITAGKSHTVIDTEYGKIGIQICRDILYPETTKIMGNLGAKIIFSPAFWSKFSSEYDESLLKKYKANDEVQTIKYLVPARALENELIFVFVNAAGTYQTKNTKDSLLGYTQICQPFTGPLEVYKHNHEKLLIQTVDTEVVDEARKNWQIRGN